VHTHPEVFGDPAASPRRQPGLELRRRRERSHARRLRLTDTAVIAAAVSAAGLFVGGDSGARYGAAPLAAATTAALWLVALAASGSREARVMGSGSAEYRRVANATGLTFGLLAVVFEIVSLDGLRAQVLVGLPVGLTALLATRWQWRAWLRRQRRGETLTARTLVVGRRRDIDDVMSQLRRTNHGYTVVAAAVLDDVATDLGATPIIHATGTAEIADAARQLNADTIVLASALDDIPDFARTLAWQLEGTAAELIVSSRLTDVAGSRISVSHLEGLSLIHVQIPQFEGTAHTLKRLLDVGVSAVACVGVGLITPAVALAIKLDSPGPVFFAQRRVGRNGREFTMWKFRSMTDSAERDLLGLSSGNEGAGPLFKLRDDPRVTRVGRILRRYSLDELPQFFNVLRGDMSISGPRPPLPSEVRTYEARVFRRLYIKPGITGLWQVSGRSDLSWEDSVSLDLHYVENWSVALDLMIMWRTVKVMLRPLGAY
jgi:exopolysaccharide biosynthesis polyprenyl glycosylphosphotransferase